MKNITLFGGQKVTNKSENIDKYQGDFNAKILTVTEIFENNFNIPVYQRLYVWETIQIETLWHDLYSAFEHNENETYYLGGIVTVENKGRFDLIDGQQRFTTLSILRDVLGDTLDKNKLNFDIREGVWDEFNRGESDNDDIRRMINAKQIFFKKSKEVGNKKEDFKNFVNECIKINFITVPSNADLNKIFELLNGRGEQLQQHEILKAKILAKVADECKKPYGKIWDMLANMDDFLEVNIRKSLNITWKDYFNKNRDDNLNFRQLATNPDDESGGTSDDGLSISKIVKNNKYITTNILDDNEDDELDTRYLSIVSFSTFLLYALVAQQNDKYFTKGIIVQFKETNLIKIFDKFVEDENFCKNFIKFLFDFRVDFDKYIIKNEVKIDDKSNDTNHQISVVSKNEYTYKNKKNVSKQIKEKDKSGDLALLQSMLYHAHTRQTQEWIIPFLNNMALINKPTVIKALRLLKNIDNKVYSQIKVEDTVLKRASGFKIEESKFSTDGIIQYLEKTPDNYHHFSRYWFYKMDWIIYCLKKDEIDNFKFTARNSIEHISPQTENKTNTDKGIGDFEYGFGNLTLVSVSQNSSFSNKSFGEKKEYFKNSVIKNLKMSLIIENGSWTNEKCGEHLTECINLVKKYFECT